jgi:hypothetical protein
VCEIWLLILRETFKLHVSENQVFYNTFVIKSDEVNDQFREFSHDGQRNLSCTDHLVLLGY